MARTYTEQEIAALLARAAERQRATPDADAGPTLTLGEIERLAADAGLDPAHVRAAAAEMDAGTTASSGIAGHTVVERWLDVPFSDVAWEETVALLRARHGTNWATYGAAGTPMVGADVSRVGAAHEWAHTAWTGVSTTVTASARGQRTRLRVVTKGSVVRSDRFTAGMYGLLVGFIPVGIAMIASGKATGSFAVALMTALATLAVVLAVAVGMGTPAVRRFRERTAQHAAELADLVAHQFEAASDDALSEGIHPPARDHADLGRVDFDAAVGDAAGGAGGEAARERRREGA